MIGIGEYIVLEYIALQEILDLISFKIYPLIKLI